MPPDSLVVVRSDFSIAEPWRSPDGATPVRLRRATDGGPPRLATTVSVFFDDEALTVVFSGSDDHVVATYAAHDDPLYEEDVVEIFIAPSDITDYFEIEVSPRGTIFDAHIRSPEGSRKTMRADRSWDAGALAAVRKIPEHDGTFTVDTVVRIPFASLPVERPRGGDRWRGNFFRIDRHPDRGDEYTAWRPTMQEPADFHVPAAFGVLEFRG